MEQKLKAPSSELTVIGEYQGPKQECKYVDQGQILNNIERNIVTLGTSRLRDYTRVKPIDPQQYRFTVERDLESGTFAVLIEASGKDMELVSTIQAEVPTKPLSTMDKYSGPKIEYSHQTLNEILRDIGHNVTWLKKPNRYQDPRQYRFTVEKDAYSNTFAMRIEASGKDMELVFANGHIVRN